MRNPWLVFGVIVLCCGVSSLSAGEPLKIAVFAADVTPPIGSPVAYAPTRSIVDPLSAKGVVLLGKDAPIVLCAVDWIGIGNGGHDTWRERLATAAGTTADRVAVQTLHQHDAPDCDFSASELLTENGVSGRRYDDAFAREALNRTAEAIETALKATTPVTHLGIGVAEVEMVASNRRILGPDGKVALIRFSSCRNAEAIAAPEGTIDPKLRLVSFWNADEPVAVLTYYACHPQSYYGKGDVTCDFVGLARNAREKEAKIPHVHFNGAGGNLAAGKYNDGSPEMRPVLAERLADGMRRAWEQTVKTPITADDLRWNIERVSLPVAPHLTAASLQQKLADESAEPGERAASARKLAFVTRIEAGVKTDIACLHLMRITGDCSGRSICM
ncbi:MAG: hypothetical protein H0T47_13425 [Planctomycetaceae bacterium]|nr:hypothetical protein [Planctomycetaceae bacterium]